MPGDQIPFSTIALSGDGHHTRQEKPVAKITPALFEVSLTAKEMFIIEQALTSLNSFYDDLAYDDDADIADTLRKEFKKARQ